MKRTSKRNNKRLGFSLVELSVVVLILSVVGATALQYYSRNQDITRADITMQKAERIKKALSNYLSQNGRLPAPADVSASNKDNGLGQELAVPDSPYLYHLATVGSNSVTNNIYVGDLPVEALGLPIKYMYDGWNKRFQYAVDSEFVDTATAFSVDESAIGLYRFDGENNSRPLLEKTADSKQQNSYVDCRDQGSAATSITGYANDVVVCPVYLLISGGKDKAVNDEENGGGSCNGTRYPILGCNKFVFRSHKDAMNEESSSVFDDLVFFEIKDNLSVGN